MGVYIKGMEMPTSCSVCDIKVRCFEDVKNIEWLTYHPAFYEERLTDCPLIEVPTPHGRLIDANALQDKPVPLNGWFDEIRGVFCHYPPTYMQAIDDIVHAPTIIPAEEDE